VNTTSIPDRDGRKENRGVFASHSGRSEQSQAETMLQSVGPNSRSAVLLDQHPIWLEAIEQVLVESGMRVAGKATSPSQALEILLETRPDVFVAEVGLQYSGMDGLTCVREARRAIRGLRIIVVSVAESPELIDEAFAAGSLAYIVKRAHPDDVGVAIRQSLDPSIFFAADYDGATAEPHSLERVLTSGLDGRGLPELEQPTGHGLTPRELEVLRMVAEGYSNGELAKMLWVTEQTVKFHLANVYRKLDVANRTEASRWAQVHNLLPEVPRHASSI
jgi:DNA-binding NarL/FixJ family response regulator